jgi:hypothetical protein
MVAILCMTSEKGTVISARRLHKQYRTRYSSYRGMAAALGRLADHGYLIKHGPNRWELTAEGLYFALEALTRRYKRATETQAA